MLRKGSPLRPCPVPQTVLRTKPIMRRQQTAVLRQGGLDHLMNLAAQRVADEARVSDEQIAVGCRRRLRWRTIGIRAGRHLMIVIGPPAGLRSASQAARQRRRPVHSGSTRVL